jgi:predicted acylesterase/phospholipase RssA
MTIPDSTDDNAPVHLFLSGGGYRAALAGIGALLALHDLGLFKRTREITSVSGGGLVNAWLAVRRPADSELSDELDTLALLLASRVNALRAALPPSGVFAIVLVFSLMLLVRITDGWPISTRWLLAILWTGLVLAATQMLLARWWLRRLFRGFGGQQTAASMGPEPWPIRHTFVASDLSLSGSVFFSLGDGRLFAFSGRRGFFQPDLSLGTLLRASTALPPALPPIRVDLGPELQLGKEASGRTLLWLADGGITGNLGIQALENITSDNPYLASSMTQYLGDQNPSTASRLVVIDASGVSPASAKWANVALWTPGLSLFYESLRALKVQYESSLADDQHLAGLTLVSVTRHAGAYKGAIEAGVEPSDRAAIWRLVNDHPQMALLLGIALDERAVRCVGARAAAAKMSTGLWPASWSLSLRVIRSGYVNTFTSLATDSAEVITSGWARHESRLNAAKRAQGQWGPTGIAELEGGTYTGRVRT